MKDVAERNLTTLAHATELASKVIHKVAGEAVATTVEGQLFTNSEIKHAVVAKMQGCFVAKQGGQS